jgi:rRNA-processing protein FCF1
MKRVLLDASFVLTLASKPLDLIEELGDILGKVELLVLEDTIKELEAISKRPSIKSKQAKLALDFVMNLERITYDFEGSVDDRILKCATENRLLVATMDKELRKRLRAMSLTVVTLRQNRLMINGVRP